MNEKRFYCKCNKHKGLDKRVYVRVCPTPDKRYVNIIITSDSFFRKSLNVVITPKDFKDLCRFDIKQINNKNKEK